LFSVNTDPDASIFNHSRFGVVADCNELIKEIIEELKNSN
jgi:Electron transfer flavoprotein, alpha subunit